MEVLLCWTYGGFSGWVPHNLCSTFLLSFTSPRDPGLSLLGDTHCFLPNDKSILSCGPGDQSPILISGLPNIGLLQLFVPSGYSNTKKHISYPVPETAE